MNFAIIGEMTATESPDVIPQVITDTISSIFTTDPVTMVFPNAAVTACNTISKAIKFTCFHHSRGTLPLIIAI